MNIDGDHYVPVQLDAVLQKELLIRAFTRRIMDLRRVTDLDVRYNQLTQLYSYKRIGPTPATLLFDLLGYRVTPNYVVDASHVHHIDWLIRDRLGFDDRDYLRVYILLLNRAGQRTYADALKRTEEYARFAWNFTYYVIHPLAEIERIIITEALANMSAGRVVRVIGRFVRWARGLKAVATAAGIIYRFGRLASRVHKFSGIRFMLAMMKAPIHVTLKAIPIVASSADNVEVTARILDQLLIAYHALSDLSDFESSIHDNGGILLGTWKQFLDPIEKALIDEVVDLFGDDIADHG